MTDISPPVPAAVRFLPAVPEGFELGDQEQLSDGLRRLSLEEFDRAIGGLVAGSDLDVAVHEARKSMKRLRAVLRLIRDELGEERYRTENLQLRNTARLIAPLRDSAVLVTTVSTIRSRFASHLRRSAFEGLEEKLKQRHEEARVELARDPAVLRRVVYALRSGRARYRVWPTGAVAHAFGSMRGGLVRTYRRGRKEMRVAAQEPSAHNFHWWRKRVKYLRHQMELLRPMFPEVMDSYIAVLDRLGELLGEEHDLSELVALLSAEPELCVDDAELTLITALAEHRRRELQLEALALGGKVYAESPRAFADRLEAYWSASFALAH